MVAIFVLVLFLSILAVDILVLKFQGKKHPAFETLLPNEDSLIFSGKVFSVPNDIYFSKGHTWLKNNKGLVSIGIDAFAATVLSDASIQRYAEAGKKIRKGEIIFEVKTGDKIIKFLSPISGVVKSVNQDLYGKKIIDSFNTWGIQLENKEFSAKGNQFFYGREALNWLNNEILRLRDFIDTQSSADNLVGVTMYDGGEVSENIKDSLNEKSFSDFEKEFLSL